MDPALDPNFDAPAVKAYQQAIARLEGALAAIKKSDSPQAEYGREHLSACLAEVKARLASRPLEALEAARASYTAALAEYQAIPRRADTIDGEMRIVAERKLASRAVTSKRAALESAVSAAKLPPLPRMANPLPGPDGYAYFESTDLLAEIAPELGDYDPADGETNAAYDLAVEFGRGLDAVNAAWVAEAEAPFHAADCQRIFSIRWSVAAKMLGLDSADAAA